LSYKDLINDYKFVVLDSNLHPYENINGLHIRTELHEEYNQSTLEEKLLLLNADVEVLNQVNEVYKRTSKVYIFKNTTKSTKQWWWHFEKIVRGELLVEFNIQTKIIVKNDILK